MREIKFRAWSPTMKKMLGWDILGDMSADLLCTETEANVPMQYTGLKGKNGKEIYEGDILERAGGERIQVDFEHSSAGFQPFVVAYSDEGDWWYPEESEVTGNICENPKLLKAD